MLSGNPELLAPGDSGKRTEVLCTARGGQLWGLGGWYGSAHVGDIARKFKGIDWVMGAVSQPPRWCSDRDDGWQPQAGVWLEEGPQACPGLCIW